VVLGGTGVLGGAMADALAAAGARVAVVGGSEERRPGTGAPASERRAVGRSFKRLTPYHDSLLAARRGDPQAMGSVTVLVNGAGEISRRDAAARRRFLQAVAQGWADVFDLNLVGGAVLPSQVFGETMVKAGPAASSISFDVGHSAAVARGGLLGVQGRVPQF